MRLKSSGRGGRRDIALAGSFVVAAVVWFANAPVRPRMLAQLTEPSPDGGSLTLLGTAGDRIYALRQENGTILAVPKGGGKPEVVVRSQPALTGSAAIGILGTDGLFQADNFTPLPAVAGRAPGPPRLTQGALYRIPLAGGEPVPLRFPPLRTQSALLIGDTCYAVESRRSPQVRIWCVEAGNSTPRLAAVSPSAFSVGPDTVTGRTGFYAQPTTRDHLVYVEKDRPVLMIPEPPRARLLAEAGDDLAWAEIPSTGGSGGPVTNLFLTRRDGTERRPLFRLTAAPGHQRLLLSMARRRGAWFGILHDTDLSGQTPAKQLLVQFLPQRENPVRVLATLPGSRPAERFEERELDFLAVEEKERWWDWSAAGLVAQRTTNLYRFPLPER